ncbi:MAG: outer membrane beta-barrel family protein [Saprospiraceae bacterium]|nr:outer membrane beta-barrel family protein [Saprospiraceae bacterium]
MKSARVLSLIKNAILFSSLLTGYHSSGQNSSVSGVLLDNSSTPVTFGTLTLLHPDSTLAGGAISEDDGSFMIKNIYRGTYILVSQHIEYATFTSGPFNLTNDEEKDLGEIVMNRASVEIEEVVVKGKRPLIEVHADKMVFNVANSINASGNDGLELLNKAPGVVIDPDNNIILQGKPGVRIFINGRPSRLSGSDLTTMLQSMQSDNILAIEIITNPSARYEAEGNAGIINIKLKNNITLGYNGHLVSSYSKGSHPRMSHGLTLNYGKDKLSANVNVTRFDNVYQQDFVDIKYQNGFLVDLGSYAVKDKFGFNLSAGLDYKLAEDHAISLSTRGVLTTGDYELNSTTVIEEINGPPVETLLAQTLTNYQSNNLNYSLNYNWDIDEETRWNTDVSYGSFLNDRRIDQPNDYLNPDGSLREEIDNSFDPFTNIDLWSLKSDFDREFDRFSISAGIKYTNILTNNDFVVNDVINGEDIIDLEASNEFSYKEEVTAGYLISKFDLSEHFGVNAGLRVEHTRSRGRLMSEQVTQNNDVSRIYTDLFPNVSLSYEDGKKNKVSIGIGRRISRPNYQDLNPFESKLSELNLFKGNPFLNPKYITNYQLTYVFDDKLVISNTYSITRDFFAKIVSINETKGTIIIPRNMDRAINNGLSVTYSLEVADWWDVSTYLGYNYESYKGEFDETVIDFSQNVFNTRIQNFLALPWEITMDLTASWNSASVWRGTVIIDPYWRINFGLRRNFWNDRLQLRVTGSDIFNTGSDYGYYGNYGGLEFDGHYGSDQHRFGIGATLKFGNNKIRKKSRKSGLDEELRRISD